ncbi:spore germination protein, partial [Anoxybacillus sp. LAT_38]|nr:spore germination protein [Anoxybacillus sp. LAT_38]
GEEMLTFLLNEVLSTIEVKLETTFEAMYDRVLAGDTALFVDGASQTILIDSRGWETRSIDEPVSEGLVRGPREGFTENIRDNTMLVRRRVRDCQLRFDTMNV